MSLTFNEYAQKQVREAFKLEDECTEQKHKDKLLKAILVVQNAVVTGTFADLVYSTEKLLIFTKAIHTMVLKKSNIIGCCACGNEAEQFCTLCDEPVCESCATVHRDGPLIVEYHCPDCANIRS